LGSVRIKNNVSGQLARLDLDQEELNRKRKRLGSMILNQNSPGTAREYDLPSSIQ
jgi:hypothetical protein